MLFPFLRNKLVSTFVIANLIVIENVMYEIQKHAIFLEEVKATDIVDYLSSLGLKPSKITRNDFWHLSPLRDEKTPSFKVNRKMNRWYDFGEGKGGNIIDFGILYHKCRVSEFLKKLKAPLLFSNQLFLQVLKMIILKKLKSLLLVKLFHYLL